MPDDATKATLIAALDRLRTNLMSQAKAAELPGDSQVRALMLKSLDKMREQIERGDPITYEGEKHKRPQ